MLWVAMSAARPEARTIAISVVEDVPGGVRIEIAGRLVGEEQARRVGDRARDGDALLLAAGQFGRTVSRRAPSPRKPSSCSARSFASACDRPRMSLRHHDVLERREFRQEMVELVDEADLHAPQRVRSGVVHAGGRLAADEDLAGVRLLQSPATWRSVDLPVPDGATSATISPGQIARSAPRRMSRKPSPCG